MARILEDHSKRLLQAAGLAVPCFEVATSSQEVKEAFERVRSAQGAFVKALVPVGSRGKSGGVRHVENAEEAVRAGKDLLGSRIDAWPVEELLVEEAVPGGQELYAAIAIDERLKKLVVLISDQGGVDINDHASSIRRLVIDPHRGIASWQARSLWLDLGLSGSALHALGDALLSLYQAATDTEAILLEVNPLKLLDSGEAIALDCVLVVDEFALFRHTELQQTAIQAYGRPMTPLEMAAVEVDERDPYQGTARYFETSGNGQIGFLCGGGGGSLTMYDALLRYGGKPANYAEIGGNPPARKVEGLAQIVVSKPGVRGLLVCCNTTNNTQVDQVAEGVVAALRSSGKDLAEFPVIFRFPGINQERARQILSEVGIDFYGLETSMEDAARLAVSRIKGAS